MNKLPKSKIIISLLSIGIISFIFKLFLVDFEIPIFSSNLDFALRAVAYESGDWGLNPKQHPGWPLFVSLFYRLIDSTNFMDYSNTIRLLSMSISTVTILPMYMLSRKFFKEKYSLIVVCLFAFEPHLNYNSGLGFTEPLYILAAIGSIFFILNNKNNKFVFLAFLLAGFMWWIRNEGVIMFFVLTVIYFINYKKSKQFIPKYLLCLILFCLVVSPLFIQRYIQYDDPFYFYYSDQMFVEDYQVTGTISGSTASRFIEEKGIASFFYKFVLGGFYSMFEIIPRILFPYLIFLVPFRMLFSLRAFDQNKKFILANWMMIIVSLVVFVVPFGVITERRFLFYLYPFMIIFAGIIVQRVVEYGLGTFSFSNKQKNIFIVCFVVVIVITSGVFSLRYQTDSILEHEYIEYAKFFAKEADGNVMGGPDLFYLYIIRITDPPDAFKTFEINKDKKPYQNFPYLDPNYRILSGDTLHEIFLFGKNNNVKYLAVTNYNEDYEFLNDIYFNEENYSFLNKIFDSKEKGYTKLKLKVFEIDYENFQP